MEQEGNIGSWDDYNSNLFLKADDVISDFQEFEIKAVENVKFEDRNKIRLHLKSSSKDYMFDLNKTNTNYLQDNSGVDEPGQLVGKKIKFRKVMVTNPTTKKEQESLRISGIS